MFDSCLSEFGCRRRQGKIQRPVKVRYRHTRQKTHILFDDEQVNGNAGSLILAEVDDRVEDSDYFDLQADLRLHAANTLTLGYTYNVGKYTSRWEDVIFGGGGKSVSKSRLSVTVRPPPSFRRSFNS